MPLDKVSVTVSKGWVTLKGEAEKEEAERAAWMAPGIIAVENRIAVSY